MKFRGGGHRRAAFKCSYRPTTSNSEVDGWGWQCRRAPILKLTYKLSALCPSPPPARTQVTRTTEFEVDKPRCDPPFRVPFDVTDFTARNDRWHPPRQESRRADESDDRRARKKYLSPSIETSSVRARLSLTRRFNIASLLALGSRRQLDDSRSPGEGEG